MMGRDSWDGQGIMVWGAIGISNKAGSVIFQILAQVEVMASRLWGISINSFDVILCPILAVTSITCSSRTRKEGNVLFNDALKTFYLRLYGVRHMVKDHSDSEKGNPLPPHRLLFPSNSKGSFICTIPQTGYHIPRPLLHQSWSTGWNEK